MLPEQFHELSAELLSTPPVKVITLGHANTCAKCHGVTPAAQPIYRANGQFLCSLCGLEFDPCYKLLNEWLKEHAPKRDRVIAKREKAARRTVRTDWKEALDTEA